MPSARGSRGVLIMYILYKHPYRTENSHVDTFNQVSSHIIMYHHLQSCAIMYNHVPSAIEYVFAHCNRGGVDDV